jgi:hypothetical protein
LARRPLSCRTVARFRLALDELFSRRGQRPPVVDRLRDQLLSDAAHRLCRRLLAVQVPTEAFALAGRVARRYRGCACPPQPFCNSGACARDRPRLGLRLAGRRQAMDAGFQSVRVLRHV